MLSTKSPRDVRLSSPQLWEAAAKGLTDAGVDVINIGLISSDMLYFCVGQYGYDAGITISASHNPAEYNGMKMLLQGGIFVGGDMGGYEIRDMIKKDKWRTTNDKKGTVTEKDFAADYIAHARGYIKDENIKPMKVVVNGNFGLSAEWAKKVTEGLPIELVMLNEKPDGTFPKGRPDPLIPENRGETSELVRSSGADLGVAWDADADRTFFFDEKGEFISGYFSVAIFAEHFLAQDPGGTIIVDPRLTWAVTEKVKSLGGTSVISKCGHTFIKRVMKETNAIFGGENSAHYFFRNSFRAENGMVAFLVMLEILSRSGGKMSQLVQPYRDTYFISEEHNTVVSDIPAAIAEVESTYASQGTTDKLDGLSIDFGQWRFNVRPSNTEPLLRVVLEARNPELLAEKTTELLAIIGKYKVAE